MTDDALDPLVLVETRGHVSILTLNRPASLNAMNGALAASLGAALDEAEADDHVRTIVLAGAGRAFCAGHDLRALADGEDPAAAQLDRGGYGGLVRRRLAKPVIAAVQGATLGGGLELALACDIVVAADDARLGLPEVRIGLFAAAGGAARLMQQLPRRVGAWFAYSGETMSAAEAERWGLVNEVVTPGLQIERAVSRAERIAANAPLAVQATKRVVQALDEQSLWDEQPWQLMSDELATLRLTADAVEGPRAFVERRPPVWLGR